MAGVVAAGWGLLLPVEVLGDLPPSILDVLRYVGVALVFVLHPRSPDRSMGRELLIWGVVLSALAAVAVGFALLNDDGDTLETGLLLGASTVAAAVVALRPASHRPILTGFFVGATASAVVTIMQSLDLPTLASEGPHPGTYAGLATTSVILSWQLAFGIIIGIHAAVSSRREPRRCWAAVAMVAVCTGALAVCGAQGGVLALLAAGAAVSVRARRILPTRTLKRYVAAAAAAVMVGAGLFVAIGLESETVEGMLPRSGYENERARIVLAEDAIRELRAHPLSGMSIEDFKAAYGHAPHTFPLHFGVSAGLTGLVLSGAAVALLAAVVVRGPRGRSGEAVLGYALAAALLAYAIPEPSGPFIGLSRLPLVAIAVVSCRGAGRPQPTAAAPPHLRGIATVA